MVNVSQGAVALGVLTLLFGGDLYSMFAGHPAEARLAQLVMIVQFSIIGIMIFGDKLFPMLGMQPPDMYEQVKDKKFAVGMAAWFFGNMAQSSLSSTGAFEVFYDGSLVFSKLETSQMPNLPAIIQSIQALRQ